MRLGTSYLSRILKLDLSNFLIYELLLADASRFSNLQKRPVVIHRGSDREFLGFDFPTVSNLRSTAYRPFPKIGRDLPRHPLQIPFPLGVLESRKPIYKTPQTNLWRVAQRPNSYSSRRIAWEYNYKKTCVQTFAYRARPSNPFLLEPLPPPAKRLALRSKSTGSRSICKDFSPGVTKHVKRFTVRKPFLRVRFREIRSPQDFRDIELFPKKSF